MSYATALTSMQERLSGISYEAISYGTDLIADTASQFPVFSAYLQRAMDVFFDDPDIGAYGDIVNFAKGNSFCSFIKDKEYVYPTIRELVWLNFGRYSKCETMMGRLSDALDNYNKAMQALETRYEQFEKTYVPPPVVTPPPSTAGESTEPPAPPPTALDVFWEDEGQATLIAELGKITDLLSEGMTQASSLRNTLLQWIQLGLDATITYGQVQSIFATKKTNINDNWTVFEALSEYVNDIDAYSPKLSARYRLCKSIIDSFPENTPDSVIMKEIKAKVLEYLGVKEKSASMYAEIENTFSVLL